MTMNAIHTQANELFDSYWKEHGIRQLNADNSIPSLEDRCRAAFEAGINHFVEAFQNAARARWEAEMNQAMPQTPPEGESSIIIP